MRLVFTEQFYYPEGWGGAQLPRDLTRFLANSNTQVEVICGSDEYASGDNNCGEDPRLAGVIIRKIPRFVGGSIQERKLLKQLVFCLVCTPLLLIRRSPTLFVTQTNPPLIVATVALAALIHRRPFVVVAQDIYPEVLFAHGITRVNSLSGRLLSATFRWAYRRATYVVALGEVMGRRLISKGVNRQRIAVISNWATGDLTVDRSDDNGLRREWGLEGKFVILYSGNVGIAHDIETPIAALRLLLKSSENVRLVVIGNGSRLEDARRAAVDAGVEDAVQFRPWVPPALLPQTFGLACVALVTLREGFEGLVVPSKLLGYMARGVPTLYVGPYSDVEQILDSSSGGKCFRNGDAAGVCAEVLALIERPDKIGTMGAAAARYYRTYLSCSQGLDKYASVIRAAIMAGRERVPFESK